MASFLRRALCLVILGALTVLMAPLHAQPTAPLSDARTAYTDGDYERAIERLRRSAATDTSAQALYLLGRSYQALVQHAPALKALENAYRLDSTSVRILQAKGQSYEALSRFDAAESAYAGALELEPSRTLHLALAGLYHQVRSWKEATYHYRVVLRSDTTNSLLHARLAQTLQAQHRTEDALTHYRRAHQLNPRDASVTLSLSRLLEQQGQPDAAAAVVDSTLHYRETAALWTRRATLAFRQDNLPAARHGYQRAIQQGDSSASTFRRLGIAEVGQGRYDAALDALHHAVERDSSNVRTHFYLGVAYREVDSLDHAEASFEETITRVANDVLVDAYVQSAVTYDAQGQLRRAIDAYKTALRVQPGRVEIYFHLATLYDDYYRDKTTAALYYRKFLAAADSVETPFHTYATNRLDALRPILHFQQGRTN